MALPRVNDRNGGKNNFEISESDTHSQTVIADAIDACAAGAGAAAEGSSVLNAQRQPLQQRQPGQLAKLLAKKRNSI